MKSTRISELYARKLSGEASPEELEEFEALLQNEEEQFFHEIIQSWWQPNQSPTNADFDDEQEAHFNYIMEAASANTVTVDVSNEPTRKHAPITYIKRAIAIAATLIGFFWLAQWGQLYWKGHNPAHYNEIIAKRGTKSKLILPDGTQVWLNSESKLSYNTNFNDSIREVNLEGEAFFDVVKDKHRPFVVKTSAISIRVLGTAFNVKSYQQDSTIEATLVRGLIEVQNNNEPSASKIILKPNEKLVYNKTDSKPISSSGLNHATSGVPPQLISISSLPKNIADSVRKETSWVYGKLVFDGDNFVTLAEKMERWYNVKIKIQNEALAKHRFVGVFENENVEDALKALKLITKFNYRIEENEIIIEK
jgi:ferric-dicitrate binding protein FerR (iron transport regulator)